MSTRPVFIIGNGRSGSCWLGRIFTTHPCIRCTVEVPPLFQLVTAAAIGEQPAEAAFPRIRQLYEMQLQATSEPIYADKSHPNLWLVERLDLAFPGARFVAIVRDPYASVASMLRHPGIIHWMQRWREFPVPNAFLGITSGNAHAYGDLTAVQKCALRWRAHYDRLAELMRTPYVVHMVLYENLCRYPEETLAEVQRFLRLAEPFPTPKVDTTTLEKWKADLDAEDRAAVKMISGVAEPT